MLKVKYLSEDKLENIKNHKYVSGQYTALDMAMQPFWNGIVELLPMWMAPNMITLIGTVFMSIGITQYWFYDLTNKEYFSPCFYYVSAACVFIYQTLDAIDGK